MQPEADWEVWLDANISPIIAKWMADEMGWNVKSAYLMELSRALDSEIYDLAQRTGNIIIISKDSDFSELVNRLGAPPKLILLAIGNTNNKKLWEWLRPNVKEAFRILTQTDVSVVVLQ